MVRAPGGSGDVGTDFGDTVALDEDVLVADGAAGADVNQLAGFDERGALRDGSLLAAALGGERKG